MPEWLTILLAVAGTLNVVGLVSWLVKTVFDLRSRIALLEAALRKISEECSFCKEDKREIFGTLKRLDRTLVAIATKMGIDLSEFNGGN